MPRSAGTGTPSAPPFARFITLASVCVIIAALYFAQEVLIPLALAMLLSFLLTPLVQRLEGWRVPRVPSVIVVVTLALGLVVGMGYIVWNQVIDLTNNLPRYQRNIQAKVERLRPSGEGLVGKWRKAAEDINKAVVATPATTRGATSQPAVGGQPPPNPAPVVVSSRTPIAAAVPPSSQPAGTQNNPMWVISTAPPRTPIEMLQTTLGPLVPTLGTAGIVIVFTIFMLLAREDMRDRLIRLIGRGQLTVTTQALDDAATRISRYLLMQSIVNGTYGIAIALGLWLIGVPNPLLWGLLCAILRFIPYIGPWIGAAFPILLALAEFQGMRQVLLTVGLFLFIELLSNNVMEPWLYGSSTGLSAVAVLVAAAFWTWLWGPIGLLLSTPLTVVLVVLGKYVPSLSFLNVMLGDEPVLARHARVYQRLLAFDQEEAFEVVREEVAKTNLEDVYENVLVPALALAEQDRHKGDLDERRQRFIRRSMRDMIEELGEEHRTQLVKTAAARTEEKARDVVAVVPSGADATPAHKPGSSGDGRGQTASDEPRPPDRLVLPKDCVVNVVLLPAHDEADEIVNLMLQQLLELRGFCAFSVSVEKLASEMLGEIEAKRADLVVVSALPPAAVTHARYLCKRIHARYPEASMVVGLWTFRGNLEKARQRVTCADSMQVATTLRESQTYLDQMTQPLLINPPTSPTTAGKPGEPVTAP
jgi:predicted PurR-regulated permease PerM